MSTFAVTREIIGEIKPIEGADRIEIATLAGMDFQFVVQKGGWKPGDEVLYFPVDAILPKTIIKTLGLEGKLAGPEQNRVKTVVLRGAYSQGIVASTMMVSVGMTDPTEITEYLGVTKWDPPPNEVPDGILVPKPTGLSKYDLESADRYTALADLLMDQPVFITEKLEGENSWAAYEPGQEAKIGMRDNTILLKEGVPNWFHTTLDRFDLRSFAVGLAARYGMLSAVYGEAIGPGCSVGNHYDLTGSTVLLFDIRVGPRFLAPEEFLNRVEAFFGKDLDMVVPILQSPDGTTLRKWLDGRTIKEASNGMSLLNPKKRREGIVIKPLVEQRDQRIGRLVLKQRSPLYLANTNL